MSESRNKRLHVVINGQNGFDERVKNDLRKYYNIWKTVTGYFLDYDYFDKYYKMIVIDLSKHQVLNADPKAIRKILIYHTKDIKEGLWPYLLNFLQYFFKWSKIMNKIKEQMLHKQYLHKSY